ncbi:hypothetical protein D910_06085 [Dendroctonus ponderosae]|uniref:Uncharacterized protein n=1 Tax=Dendroctonus ponderosae TaxID=77166 RepID=U4U8L9_DENPD|nr:hypothetical protein D910_06085 [Dendroctonus ponderosae]
MGKYSSDSDNDRRSNKSLKNRSRYRTSSSDSSDSRKNRRSAKKSHRRSRSKERYSRSGDRYRSRRSRSKSYIKEYTSKPKRSSSSSSSSSDRSRTKKRPEKSQLAVECKPNNKPKPVVVDDDDDCVIVDSETIQQINEDKFVPKAFSSGKPVKSNIVIDLNKQTIKVPEVNRVEPDSIFHHALFASPEVRLEKWIKELCSYRQKALQQGWKNE